MVSSLPDLFLVPLLSSSLALCTCVKAESLSDYPLSHPSLWLQNEECIEWVEDKAPILCTSPSYLSRSPPRFLPLCRRPHPSARNNKKAVGSLGIALHRRLPKANDQLIQGSKGLPPCLMWDDSEGLSQFQNSSIGLAEAHLQPHCVNFSVVPCLPYPPTGITSEGTSQ